MTNKKELTVVVRWPLAKCHITVKHNGTVCISDEKKEWGYLIDGRLALDEDNDSIKTMAPDVGETPFNIAKKLSELRSHNLRKE